MKEESPAELVKRLIDAGYSQQEIADSVGCSQATISYIAKGRRTSPRYNIIDALRYLALQVKAGNKAHNQETRQ